ncbi:MAG: hypothetical protein V4555_01810 [Acidobacteriota bacterium]
MFKKIVFLAVALASVMLTTATTAKAQNEGHAVYATLKNEIDLRSAKPGDYVSAQLVDSVSFKDGSRLSKGVFLTGRIVTVDPAANSFSLVLDRVQSDGQKPSAISVVVRRIDASVAADDLPDAEQIKPTGDPVSKVRGVLLANATNASSSALFSSKSKSLHLDYGTFLGCIVSR